VLILSVTESMRAFDLSLCIFPISLNCLTLHFNHNTYLI
jgi:hypothetical protein